MEIINFVLEVMSGVLGLTLIAAGVALCVFALTMLVLIGIRIFQKVVE